MTTTSRPRPPDGDWLGTPFVRFERQGALAVVTVDRPGKRNALTGSMYYALRYAVDRVTADPDLAGTLITGTGDVFIPGGDLSGSNADDWEGSALLGLDSLPFATIRHARKPVVSAVNGLCQGGGLLIACFSDVAVVAESATFRAPELLRGIADTGFAQWLPVQIGPARARDMLFTGRTLTSAEAVAWGLVSRVVPDDQVVAQATEVLRAICRTAPGARNAVKRVISESYGAYDRMTMESSLGADGEAAEGFAAFRERRDPAWVAPELRTYGRH